MVRHHIRCNNILKFQESTTILNVCTKKAWKLIERTTYLIHMYKKNLALNNLQWFICHKTKPNQGCLQNLLFLRHPYMYWWGSPHGVMNNVLDCDIVCLLVCVLSQINICRLFNAKCIFIQINNFILNNSV